GRGPGRRPARPAQRRAAVCTLGRRRRPRGPSRRPDSPDRTWQRRARAVILVGGEALFDLVQSSGDDLHGHPGGAPYNTARTIGRLEQPVAYPGRVSTDPLGGG